MKDELALLKAAKQFDQDALVAIFDMYASSIYGYSMRLCHDQIQSDKLVGHVFAQLLEKLATGTGPLISLRSYLYQIAHQLIVDCGPRNHRYTGPETAAHCEGNGVTPSTQSEAEDHFLMQKLVSSLNTELTEIQQHVIILRFLEGFSLGETAAIVGKNVNNVKIIQNRGIINTRGVYGLRDDNDRYEGSL